MCESDVFHEFLVNLLPSITIEIDSFGHRINAIDSVLKLSRPTGSYVMAAILPFPTSLTHSCVL